MRGSMILTVLAASALGADIEFLTPSAHASEVGQAVVNPFDGMRSVESNASRDHHGIARENPGSTAPPRRKRSDRS